MSFGYGSFHEYMSLLNTINSLSSWCVLAHFPGTSSLLSLRFTEKIAIVLGSEEGLPIKEV